MAPPRPKPLSLGSTAPSRRHEACSGPLGKIGDDKIKKTILIYGHFDVQPVCVHPPRTHHLPGLSLQAQQSDGRGQPHIVHALNSGDKGMCGHLRPFPFCHNFISPLNSEILIVCFLSHARIVRPLLKVRYHTLFFLHTCTHDTSNTVTVPSYRTLPPRTSLELCSAPSHARVVAVRALRSPLSEAPKRGVRRLAFALAPMLLAVNL
ncbi:hypothetical protein BC826DRAFT_575699 [Russula brevipes]|nr:hypothetical protein BC826DRAFT_575699 [Russula brevipes]